jgi:hypothetical protein
VIHAEVYRLHRDAINTVGETKGMCCKTRELPLTRYHHTKVNAVSNYALISDEIVLETCEHIVLHCSMKCVL